MIYGKKIGDVVHLTIENCKTRKQFEEDLALIKLSIPSGYRYYNGAVWIVTHPEMWTALEPVNMALNNDKFQLKFDFG